jgi:subtilisin family serine protease
MATLGPRTSLAAGAALLVSAGVLVAPIPAIGAQAAAAKPVLTGDYTDSQWNLLSTSLESVHTAGHTGKGTTIAILDTEYDGTHPEIAPNVVEAFRVVDETVKEVDPADMNSAETHGTHVAGIAAGVADGKGMTGVAPEASLILGEVHGPSQHPELWPSVIAALDHVAGRADVINISLGFPKEFIRQELRGELCAAIGRASAAGSVVVIAAGNSGGDGNPPILPAGCEAAITVTSLDPDLSLSAFSSFDSYVSLAAPGRDILGPLARANLRGTPYAVEPRPLFAISGTSMAAPFVAGVAALVVEEFPDLTPAQVRTRLTDTAKDLGPRGFDPDFGYGAVSPAAALGLSALPAPLPTAFPSAVRFDVDDFSLKEPAISSRWSPPGAGGEIEGYTISILGYGADDSWTVQAREVRDLRVSALMSGWISLTVHTSEGSFTTPYSPLGVGGGGVEPAFSDLGARWTDDNRMRINWTLREPLGSGQTFDVYVGGRAPVGYEAIRVITIDPQGRTSGVRTVDVAERGHSNQVRTGLRQFAAGSPAFLQACTPVAGCDNADVSPSRPLIVGVASTGRTTGNLILQLSDKATDACPLRRGFRSCQGVTARVSMAGKDYVARFNAMGEASVPVTRAPGSAVNRVDVTFPRLDVGGPFRLQAVTLRSLSP